MADSYTNPNEQEKQIRTIMRRVRSGDAQGGVKGGEEYLAKYPDDHWFRGHVAWWHASLGNREEALKHYRSLALAYPDNAEVAAQIAKLG